MKSLIAGTQVAELTLISNSHLETVGFTSFCEEEGNACVDFDEESKACLQCCEDYALVKGECINKNC